MTICKQAAINLLYKCNKSTSIFNTSSAVRAHAESLQTLQQWLKAPLGVTLLTDKIVPASKVTSAV